MFGCSAQTSARSRLCRDFRCWRWCRGVAHLLVVRAAIAVLGAGLVAHAPTGVQLTAVVLAGWDRSRAFGLVVCTAALRVCGASLVTSAPSRSFSMGATSLARSGSSKTQRAGLLEIRAASAGSNATYVAGTTARVKRTTRPFAPDFSAQETDGRDIGGRIRDLTRLHRRRKCGPGNGCSKGGDRTTSLRSHHDIGGSSRRRGTVAVRPIRSNDQGCTCTGCGRNCRGSGGSRVCSRNRVTITHPYNGGRSNGRSRSSSSSSSSSRSSGSGRARCEPVVGVVVVGGRREQVVVIVVVIVVGGRVGREPIVC
mmetsp:Transcript_38087/g.74895  ORF Transcript_38087/g.74895 Transcript_38087/m.74895 type:complete len:311 (+) Transcript_38087:797-1729(+)